MRGSSSGNWLLWLVATVLVLCVLVYACQTALLVDVAHEFLLQFEANPGY